MKNYAEMSDFEINKAVATLQGYDTDVIQHFSDAGLSVVKTTEGSLNYCKSWSDAGPIIDANKIAMIPETDGTWFALGNPKIKNNWRVESTGAFHNDTTPLRAAMIVFLMMHEND